MYRGNGATGYGGSHGGTQGSGSYSGRGGQGPGARGGGGGGRRGGGGGHRHPAGLTGREIGEFYMGKSKQKQKVENVEKRPILTLSRGQRAELEDEVWTLEKLQPFPTSSRNTLNFRDKYNRNLEQNRLKEKSLGSAVEFEDKGEWESNPILAEAMRQSFLKQRESSEYQRMLEFRRKLPAFQMRDDLLSAIHGHQVVVISGETGCGKTTFFLPKSIDGDLQHSLIILGKTTQVPQLILDDILEKNEGDRCKIVCTQPRRISAISIAERVAEERGETCGGYNSSVGFQIRLEAKAPREQGSLIYCTTGVVLQWLRSNPLLQGFSHIILDEIHERDINGDFLITCLKDILPKRPDLKVVLMSATLNAELFSKYFNNCKTINIPGFTFPVEELYLEDVLEMTRFRIKVKEPRKDAPVWHKHTKRGKEGKAVDQDFVDFVQPYLRDLGRSRKYSAATIRDLECPESEALDPELIATLIKYIHTHERDGAILVFLPGWEDISKLNRLLTDSRNFCLGSNVVVFPLHSLMPTVNQREIFSRPPPGCRKIVIATNIAETSITIDDVVYVVDCGKIKMTTFDASANITSLKPEWVSLANARQRRGRAGRVQRGICYHLYTRGREMALDQFVVPEMQRTRLEEVVLQIKILEMGKAASFLARVMEPPPPEALDSAIAMLKTINALDYTEQLTPLGFHLAHLPMDPQTGKMILLAAIFSCLDPILSVAASLTFKDAFYVPLGEEERVDRIRKSFANGSKSDHLMMANTIRQWEEASSRRAFCQQNYLSDSTLRLLDNMKKQLARHLLKLNFIDSDNVKSYQSNRNSGNQDLLRAVICAGLYPNVASVTVKGYKGPDQPAVPILATSLERRVSVHPKSVNAKEGDYKYPWMVYHLKMKTNGTMVYDSTMVSPMALIFFGEHLRTGEDIVKNVIYETISIDNFVTFTCAGRTSRCFRFLREDLDELLKYKVANPGITDWDPKKKEGALLRTIINLLSLVPKGSHVNDDDDY